MKTLNTELVQIKHTKSLKMAGDASGVLIEIKDGGVFVNQIFLPSNRNRIKQLQRGLLTWEDKFYRKSRKPKK